MSGPTLLVIGNLVATKYSPKQSELDKMKPVDYIMEWIDNRLLKAGTSILDRVMILQSSTGSGKSTILPPEFYHLFFEKDRRAIACTQPRVFNAIDVPRGLLEFHTTEYLKSIGQGNRTPLEMGKNIGFQTGPFERRPIKGITYMTIGVLKGRLNVMSNTDFMDKHSIIFIDEAHERSNDLDNTLFLMKRFIEQNYQNPKCPIMIVMSATLDTELFADYLLSSVSSKPQRYSSIVKVTGSTYPIEHRFLDYDAESYIKGTIDILVGLHEEFAADFLGKNKNNDKKSKKIKKIGHINDDTVFRDVAIFVPGKIDYEDIARAIHKLNSNHSFFQRYPVLPLYIDGTAVSTQNEAFQSLFKPIDKLRVEVRMGKKQIKMVVPSRKIIMGTPTMETGITIDTLRHVIEMGYMQTSLNCSPFGFNVLQFQPVSQDIAIQREGRVGRKFPGIAWHTYTKETYDALDKHPLPDVLKDPIDAMMLSTLIKLTDPENTFNELDLVDLLKSDTALKQIRNAKIDLYKLDLFTMPPPDALHTTIEKLFILGAIDSNCTITPIGLTLNKFTRYPLESAKMILSGYAWGASIQDLITIAAFINTKKSEVFRGSRRPNYKKALARGEFNLFPESDVFKSSLIVADDFIDGLIIFDTFTAMIDKTWPTGRKTLQEWCESRGLVLRGLMNMIEIRDEFILLLFNNGFDPYANSQNRLNSKFLTTEIVEVVRLLKQCIFEGYKINLAYKSGNDYITLKGMNKVIIDLDVDAQYVVLSQVMGFLDQQTNLYNLRGFHASAMDGYVPVDIYYDTLV